jgi:uncharacterized repeat protein (TIGR01451 family)
MQLTFEMGRGGAAGGELTVVERSMLGTCEITVETEPGTAPDTLAEMVAAAFQASGEPDPGGNCPAMENPRDVVLAENGVRTALASELVVYTNDRGIGYTLQPVALVPGSANLEIAKTDGLDPVSPGSQLNYALAVTNRGPAPATNVRVSDTLPASRPDNRRHWGDRAGDCPPDCRQEEPRGRSPGAQ